MICLFTDFSLRDFYVGQMHAAIYEKHAGAIVVDLFHHADMRDVESAARLLARLVDYTPSDAVIACVVDPGVGGSRKPLMVKTGERWLVGPDNGLFSFIIRAGNVSECREIRWRPAHMSNTFHGRDLFAPVAAMLDFGSAPDSIPCEPEIPDWPLQSQRIIYRDHYGNLITGLPAGYLAEDAVLNLNGTPVAHADHFSAVEPGQTFWMVNSIGLVEIAANQANASECLNASVGDRVLIQA